jgi:hypothetical protein
MTVRQSKRRLTSLAMAVMAVLAALAACGVPEAKAPAIVVTFLSPPPTSIIADSTSGITAVVANDTTGSDMVNWSCAPAGDCGSFNPAQIASNVPTCYEAPATAPSGGSVTVTATSVTDPTKSITSSPIEILSGTPSQPCEP